MATKVVEDPRGQAPDPDSKQNCMNTSVLDDDVQEGLEALISQSIIKSSPQRSQIIFFFIFNILVVIESENCYFSPSSFHFQ